MVESFLLSLKGQGKSDATLKTYRTQLRKFFSWLELKGYNVNPKEISSMDVADFRNYLQDQNKLPSTVNTALATIKSFCQWMQEEGYTDSNPCTRVQRIAQVEEPPKWLNRNERARLLRVIEKEKDLRNIVIILTLLLAGLRATELCSLKHEDVLISERKGEIIVRKGKGNKRRVVPLTKDLRYWLGKYMIEDHISGKWLFDSQRSEQITYFGVYRLCESIGKKANIDGLTPHVLRHTYGHDLATKDVTIQTIATLMGHSKIDTTMVYVKPGRDELQNAVDKLSYT
jgi:site-specific recombinase XerD